MFKKIFLDAPSVGQEEKRYLNKAIDSGFVSTIGPFVEQFEEKFASYLSIKKAVSLQSGTAAIHMALHELGIKKNDEVIVPVLTFIATVNPVIYVGARPVFIDVDINTWNVNASEIRKRITKKTKAIIPVHLYGNPCNMEEIMDIAKQYNLYVIEDATESLGAKYNGKLTGTFGKFGCFSFNGNKIITTGGGGMIVSRDVKRINHIRFLINQARSDSSEYFHPEIGFNYRMTNLEAAIGIAQSKKIEIFLSKKTKFNSIYKKELKNIGRIRFQDTYKQAESSFWFNCIVIDKCKDIVSLQHKLMLRGVPTRRIFMPIIESAPYRFYKDSNYKNSYYIFNNGLALPSSTLNSEDDIYYVCQIIKRLIK